MTIDGCQDSISAHDAQSPIAMSEFQFNSPFPTSNFSPRLPLVRYGYLPVFPTMSPHESRNLVLFLEGDPLAKPYDLFDVPIGANVFRLKAAIKERVKIHHDVDADRMKLRKVVSLKFQGRAPSDFLFQLNVMVPIGPDHSLAQRLADLGNIAACSKELSSEEVVGELFPEPHSEKHLHIVAQCPEILAPPSQSGEYRWLIVPV
jgi:hypothetical protein